MSETSRRARRAIAAFDSTYQSKSAHLQEALLTPRQRGEALERRADELARKVEGLGPRARERAVKGYFARCEAEGYASDEAREAMRAAYGARKEARRREDEARRAEEGRSEGEERFTPLDRHNPDDLLDDEDEDDSDEEEDE